MDTLHEIRRVAATLAAGAPSEIGACRHWTEHHLSLVRSQALGPWLYKSLREHPAAGLSPEILEALHQDYRMSAVASLSREACLAKLLDAFNLRGLPILLLKGAYLGRFVYKDPALRPMNDVDILVRDEDFSRCRQELVALGYTFVEQSDCEYHLQLGMPVTYVRPGNMFDVVDLHSAIRSMDYYCFSSSVLWNDATEAEFQGRKIYYFSPEMNFIHLAVHNLNHVGLLRDWVDLVLLLRNEELNWERLLQHARSLGALRPLFWIFQELQRNWDFQPPAIVISELSQYVPRWLEDRVIHDRFRYFWRLFSRVAALDGWGPRLQYFRLKLLASSASGIASGGAVGRLGHLKEKLALVVHFWHRG